MAQHWKIVAQQQVDKLTANSAFVPTMEITFETIPEGVQGRIAVELRNYSPEYVQTAIDEYVQNIKAVANL